MTPKRLIIIIAVICIIGGIIFAFFKKEKHTENQEIVPEQEISEEQERETVISLYFKNKESGELDIETRTIDVKELYENAYGKLLDLLIEGPKIEKLESTIPIGTKVNKIFFDKSVICIDFSYEFIENHLGGLEEESNTIYSIVNTLTELNEVTAVKISIDGNENAEFKDGMIKFSEPFQRNV